MRLFRPRRLVCPGNAHPLVKRLFHEMTRQQVTMTDLAERSGVAHQTISAWRTKASPSLTNIEATFGVLGYRLRVAPIVDGG